MDELLSPSGRSLIPPSPQDQGIAPGDITKLEEAGYHTVESIAYTPKKVLKRLQHWLAGLALTLNSNSDFRRHKGNHGAESREAHCSWYVRQIIWLRRARLTGSGCET